MQVCTRFAPSPTGYLHIGGARTALYAWLYARKHQGKFILRIEDTDRERSTQASVQAILDAMEWLNLDYDAGPYYQTQRFERYATAIQQLLAAGKAYRCCCSKTRLDDLRKQQMQRGEKPRYDGYCRDKALSASEQDFVVRFRNPLSGEVVVDDQVYGKVVFKNAELDDLIIQRSDGTPTYNFTVVVDDWNMGITHVVRGDDHLNNTPRQMNMLQALGANLPIYAHVPMLLGPDGKRLSKRHGAVSVMQYRDEGYLPQALLNYLVRLGWSHGDQEIFSRAEMVEFFDLKAINRSASAFNPEKLTWLNQHYIKTLPMAELKKPALWQFEQAGIDLNAGPKLEDVITAQRERGKTLQEIAEASRYFYTDVTVYDNKAVAKHIKPAIVPVLEDMCTQFKALAGWHQEAIHAVVHAIAEKHDLKLGKVAQPLRIAMTGSTVSPPIDVTLALLGKEITLTRLRRFIETVKKGK